MIETLKFICISGIPKGKECAAFTCSGGGATMVADIGERLNLKFSKFFLAFLLVILSTETVDKVMDNFIYTILSGLK